MSMFEEAEKKIKALEYEISKISILQKQQTKQIENANNDVAYFANNGLPTVKPGESVQKACDDAFAEWIKERQRILHLPGLGGVHKLAAANQSTVTVFLAPGRHVIQGTLIVRGGVKIVGMGRVILDFPSAKRGEDLPEDHRVNYGPFAKNKVAILFDTDANDAKTFAAPGESGIENCEIQAGSAFGVAVQGTRNNFNVRNCKFKGYPQLGDDPTDFMKGGVAFLPKFDEPWQNGMAWKPSSPSWQTDTHIEDCIFESMEMGIVGSCGEQPHIQRNQFNSVRHACVVWSVVRGVIRDNSVFMVPKYSHGERAPEEAFLINAAHEPTLYHNNWIVGHSFQAGGDGYGGGSVCYVSGSKIPHRSFRHIIGKAWR